MIKNNTQQQTGARNQTGNFPVVESHFTFFVFAQFKLRTLFFTPRLDR